MFSKKKKKFKYKIKIKKKCHYYFNCIETCSFLNKKVLLLIKYKKLIKLQNKNKTQHHKNIYTTREYVFWK